MKKTIVLFVLLSSILLHLSYCSTKTKKANDLSGILSPAEAIADFTVEEGFEIQTVAAEPLVEDPVALQFDENGALWVVEMRGYMQDKDGLGENLPLGRIKILQDANDDGRYEKSQVFLDSLVMPRAIAIVQGGVLVIEPPQLYFVENNVGKSGKKVVIDSLFAEAGNVEHQPNGLMRAMDNWLYAAKSNKRVRFVNNTWVVERTQFRGQWGITQDNYGRLFYNDNSTILMGDNFFPNVFGENDAYQRQSKKTYSVQMVSNRVFPARPTTGVNRGYEKGMLDSTKKLVNATAACGPVIYRGDNFPESYQGNAFVMEPSAYLIKRIILNQDSLGFVQGAFAYGNKEFLTATDERFRPVNAFTAPDGSLYFIDMHRGIIQHTTYLTPYLRKYIDSLKLERPISMGRIYRLKWKEHGLSKKVPLSRFSPSELVKLLEHKNGWYRDMAQRLLVEQADTIMLSQLKNLASSPNAITALHALYTLEGLQRITPDFLETLATTTGDKRIYLACMKLLEGFPSDEKASTILKNLALKPDRLVALQFTNSLPHFEKAFPKKVKTLLLQQWRQHRSDTLFLDAYMGSAVGREKERLAWLGKRNRKDTALQKALRATIAKRAKSKQGPAATLPKREADLYYAGENVFKNLCATCHGATGDGIKNVAPPLAGSEWVLQKDVSIPIRILLDGLTGPVQVARIQYAPPRIQWHHARSAQYNRNQ